ncbi:hypothetical protein RGQ13_19145 [Thalassotalea psychrophila]|uniref:Uncharacterized protein n=1 Tax=Thalassotalea psychrophila TaxID=3065647 RepID=A0ABY9TWR7_9GAMM|nr:hypothetical protein RGQ13_19145 [Colwelliaceae bacterium SQ149]
MFSITPSYKSTSKLLNVCALIFLVSYFGKQLVPEVFGTCYIQYTSYLVLAVLLPFGFATSLISRDKKSKKTSPLFLLLSLFMLVMPVVGNVGITLANNLPGTGIATNNKITTQLLKMSVHEELKVRTIGAQQIYRHYGVSVEYRNDSNQFIKYIPSDDDISQYEQVKSTDDKLEETQQMLSKVGLETMYFPLGFAVMFIIIFTLVLRRENH